MEKQTYTGDKENRDKGLVHIDDVISVDFKTNTIDFRNEEQLISFLRIMNCLNENSDIIKEMSDFSEMKTIIQSLSGY